MLIWGIVSICAMLIPIVAIAGALIVRPWIRMRERQMKTEASMVAEKAAQYAAQSERLEQRVRVLERIVTDKGIDLSNEIERLRDERPLN